MTIKHTVLIVLSIIGLCSCNKDGVKLKTEAQYSAKVLLSTKAGSSLNAPENTIEKIDLYTFRKVNGESNYTFEKRFLNTPINKDLNGESINLVFEGSTERLAYFIANTSELNMPLLESLTSSTTSTQFENQLIINNTIPATPLTMVSKQTLSAILPSTPIQVSLEHTLACLDINNQYNGFTVDSLVLKDAICGSFLLKSEIPLVQQIVRKNINYGTNRQIFLYQTNASVLAIYGKYNGIRAVFDIALNSIQRGTRYNVTFRSVNDAVVNFASNLQWSVTPWEKTPSIESTPDWKQ